MREIHTGLITEAVKEMCIEANHVLARDMEQVFNLAVKGRGVSFGAPGPWPAERKPENCC